MAPVKRSGRSKGGKARAAALDPARRSEIAREGAQARWKGHERKHPKPETYPLRIGVHFTAAEAKALASLATALEGGSTRQPLITALNRIKSELKIARSQHKLNPSGRIRWGSDMDEPDEA